MSQKELLGKYSMDTIASCAFGVDSQAFTNKGRAHDMFSRIFRVWIYEIVPRNIICFDFISAQNWVKKVSFWPIINFFFNWELLLKKSVDSYSRNSWKNVMNSLKDSKFVEYAQNIFKQSAKDGLKLALVMLPFDLG